jgi:hypothetical protein
MVCTCKKFTKFIINEINKDNFIREKFYKKTKNRKYTCKQLLKFKKFIYIVYINKIYL